MKRLIVTTLMSMVALGAFAQGTVNFLNDTVTLPGNKFIRFAKGTTPGNVYGTNNAPAVGTNIQVQLYFGASGATEAQLIAVTAAPGRLRGSTTTSPGVWSGGGFRTLDGFPFGAGVVALEIKSWDINAGATYAAALAAGGLTGNSGIFLYTVPATSSDPLGNFAMSNFAGFSVDVVPEPTTFALLGLSGAALMIFRRRK